jgi:SAM-dependent methyltransferase
VLHILLLLSALLVLPLRLPAGWSPPAHSNPVGAILLLLAVSVGLPFAIVSTTAPLLQRWFASGSDGKSQADPYFLYAASNVGSMLALLSYPLLIEPGFELARQRLLWSMLYGLLIALIGGCALAASRSAQGRVFDHPSTLDVPGPTTLSRLRWIVLSMVPASYLLGVTTYITTDIAAFPLLWVLPLAIYLLSFILVFSRRSILRPSWMIGLLPVAVVMVSLWMIAQLSQPLWLILSAHLLAFFVAIMVCHGELVRSRPAAVHLTEFYLMMSIGGVLGGMFNALVAPIIFRTPAEYPLAIVAACLLCPARALDQAHRQRLGRTLDITIPISVGLLTAALLAALRGSGAPSTYIVLLLALPLLICFATRKRSLRFGLSIGAALLASALTFGSGDRVLLTRRSFFGVHRLVRNPDGPFNELYHGTTLHGRQHLDPRTLAPDRPDDPLTYYHRSGPAGRIMEMALQHWPGTLRIGAVGLGTGSLAAYARDQTQLTFFEIDPVVLALARDSGAFTFLSGASARGADLRFVLGDARLTLDRMPDRSFDLLVLDAFSSDAIPVHLLTTQAMEIYRRKLRDGGWIAIHVSNQYLDLRPVVANLAEHFKLICLAGQDTDPRSRSGFAGKESSIWLLLISDISDAAPLVGDAQWTRLDPDPRIGTWNDDFSNVVQLLRWNW